MRGGSSRDVLRQLRTLYRCGVIGQLSDEQLLDKFVARRDDTAEDAFSALVQRHGPMVLGVCHRVLGNAHEAEDAFQATFLVLARKATSVVRRERVASWLYGVACRTAREARSRASRRRSREECVSKPARVEPDDGDSLAELRAILDEELARLPARYRDALVLCELEGLSRQQAALRLGIPEGTLSSRLARAKVQLRDRLIRRGLALPVVALTAALLREACATTLQDAVFESTVGAAMRVAAGSSASGVVSASVASLTEGVLKAMLLAKLKVIVLCIGTLAVVFSGVVVLAQVPDTRSGATQSGAPPAGTDRTTAMERKLDRIIDALDRMTGTAAVRDATSHANNDVLRILAGIQAQGSPHPESPTARLPQTRDTHKLPLADRMEAVERALGAVQHRLEHVEMRLTELDKRVGNAERWRKYNRSDSGPSGQQGAVNPENQSQPSDRDPSGPLRQQPGSKSGQQNLGSQIHDATQPRDGSQPQAGNSQKQNAPQPGGASPDDSDRTSSSKSQQQPQDSRNDAAPPPQNQPRD